MNAVWWQRLRVIAAGLLVVAAACLAASGILFAAGDQTGGETLLGASAMAGLCFVIDVSILAFRVQH